MGFLRIIILTLVSMYFIGCGGSGTDDSGGVVDPGSGEEVSNLIFSDDFERADGNLSDSADWSDEQGSSITISSGSITDGQASYAGDTAISNNYIVVDTKAGSNFYNTYGVFIYSRVDFNVSNSGYVCMFANLGGPNLLTIITDSQLAEQYSPMFDTGIPVSATTAALNLACETTSTHIKLYVDGVEMNSYEMGTHASDTLDNSSGVIGVSVAAPGPMVDSFKYYAVKP